jgi:hypothetical protein
MTDQNIIDVILELRKKYIILISGCIWWTTIRKLISYLIGTIKFELIVLESKFFPKSLMDINFIKLNSEVREILDRIKKNEGLSSGLIIIGYTFPTNLIDFPVDIHININIDNMLLNKLIVEVQKQKNIKRMEFEDFNSFITESYNSNKINKYIKITSKYETEFNYIYHTICKLIFDNIEKKIYGDNYEKFKTKELDIIDSTVDLATYNISDTDSIDFSSNESKTISDSTTEISDNDLDISTDEAKASDSSDKNEYKYSKENYDKKTIDLETQVNKKDKYKLKHDKTSDKKVQVDKKDDKTSDKKVQINKKDDKTSDKKVQVDKDVYKLKDITKSKSTVDNKDEYKLKEKKAQVEKDEYKLKDITKSKSTVDKKHDKTTDKKAQVDKKEDKELEIVDSSILKLDKRSLLEELEEYEMLSDKELLE